MCNRTIPLRMSKGGVKEILPDPASEVPRSNDRVNLLNPPTAHVLKSASMREGCKTTNINERSITQNMVEKRESIKQHPAVLWRACTAKQNIVESDRCQHRYLVRKENAKL